MQRVQSFRQLHQGRHPQRAAALPVTGPVHRGRDDCVSLMDELLFRTLSPSSVVAASSSGVMPRYGRAAPGRPSPCCSTSWLHLPHMPPRRICAIDERMATVRMGMTRKRTRRPPGHSAADAPSAAAQGAGSRAERLRLMLPHLEHQDDGLAGDAGGVYPRRLCVTAGVQARPHRHSCPSTESGADMATHDDLRGTLVDFSCPGCRLPPANSRRRR